MIGDRIIDFLARAPRPTHVYERAVVLFVEALCLLAVIVAAPPGLPTYLLLIRAPLQLRKVASDHAARSGAARRREYEEMLGIDPIKLSCAKALEREARDGQLVTATMPFVDIAGAWALASDSISLLVPALIGFGCALVRLGLVEGYGHWRRWYVRRRAEQMIVYRDHDSVFIKSTYLDTEMALRLSGRTPTPAILRPKVYSSTKNPPTA